MKQLLFLGLVFWNIYFVNSQDTIPKDQSLQEIVIRKKKGERQDRVSQNLDDILEKKAEITMIRRGNFALEPTIRGLNGAQINMQIDGMQLFGACTDRMDPISSYIEPSNLESIHVSTQSSDANTGNGLIGGINFRTRTAPLDSNNTFRLKLGSSYRSNGNGVKTFFSSEYSRKKWAIGANGIYRQSNSYQARKGRTIFFSQYQKFNFGINTQFRLNSNSSLVLSYLHDDGFNIGYPALTMDVAFAKAKIGSISWRNIRQGKSLYFSETKLYINSIDHAMDDTKRPPEQVFMHMDMPGTSTTFGFYQKMKFKLLNNHFISTNINGFQNDLHAEMTMYPDAGSPMFMLTIPDAQRREVSINLAYKYFGKKFYSLHTGIRTSLTNSTLTSEIGRKTIEIIHNGNPFNSAFNISIFSNHSIKLGRKTNIRLLTNYSTRNGSTKEMYGFFLFNRNDNYDYLGNPKIKQEKLVSGEIKFSHQQQKFEVHLSGFHYHFFDYITGTKLNNYSVMTFGASGVKQYSNIASASISGVEFEVHWQLIKNLKLHSTNSYSHGVDYAKRNLPLISPFTSRNHLRYELYSIHFELEYVKTFTQNEVNFDFYGETKSLGYDLFNISIEKTFETKNHSISIKAEVQNLFDVAYANHLDVMKINRPGRSFNITCIWNFRK